MYTFLPCCHYILFLCHIVNPSTPFYADSSRQNGFQVADLPSSNGTIVIANTSTSAPYSTTSREPSSPPTARWSQLPTPFSSPHLISSDDRLSLRRPPQGNPGEKSQSRGSPTYKTKQNNESSPRNNESPSSQTNESSPPSGGSSTSQISLFVKPLVITEHQGSRKTLECLRKSDSGKGWIKLPKKRTVRWQYKSEDANSQWVTIQRRNKKRFVFRKFYFQPIGGLEFDLYLLISKLGIN